MTVLREEVMQFRSCATFLFSFFAFSLSLAYADEVSKGRDLFLRNCIACHAFACNKEGSDSGPRLGGLFGRKAAGVDDYDGYSEGLRNSGIIWTKESLNAYFQDPARVEPDNTMAYDGEIEDPDQRRQMIAFLATEDPTVNLCPQE